MVDSKEERSRRIAFVRESFYTLYTLPRIIRTKLNSFVEYPIVLRVALFDR